MPLEGAPVFVFKPLDPRARTKWLNLLFDPREDLNPLSNEKYLDMFDERLVRIDNLEVGPEGEAVPFDKAKHLIHVPMEWQMEVAMNILTRARFSEDDAGK